MKSYCFRLVFVAAISLAVPCKTLGITLGQVDTFEGGTAQGWNPLLTGVGVDNANGGGPAGINDHYLSVHAGGSNGQFKLQTYNDLQWTGNYTAAGVTRISMDLKTFFVSQPTLPIRIAIAETIGGTSSVGYCSATPYSLVADGLWHHAEFSLDQFDMAAVNSPNPLSVELTGVAEMRLISSTASGINWRSIFT